MSALVGQVMNSWNGTFLTPWHADHRSVHGCPLGAVGVRWARCPVANSSGCSFHQLTTMQDQALNPELLNLSIDLRAFGALGCELVWGNFEVPK